MYNGVINCFKSIYYPDNIYINGKKEEMVNYSYYFNQTDNYVELIWNNSITNCENMFRGCSSITEINLLNFDTSKVKNMNSMFYNCLSLTSLNVSNFNTLKVMNMNEMFAYCNKLTFLDLSNFNTSNV